MPEHAMTAAEIRLSPEGYARYCMGCLQKDAVLNRVEIERLIQLAFQDGYDTGKDDAAKDKP